MNSLCALLFVTLFFMACGDSSDTPVGADNSVTDPMGEQPYEAYFENGG